MRRLGCPLSQGARGFAHPEPIGVTPLQRYNNCCCKNANDVGANLRTYKDLRHNISENIKEFKRANLVSFLPLGNAMGRRPYWSSHMEASYCTFGFGVIIRRDLSTLLLPRDLPRDIKPVCVRDLSSHSKGNSRLTKLFGRLSYEKIRRYNNSHPYVMARWPPQQIPPLNFLGKYGSNLMIWNQVSSSLILIQSKFDPVFKDENIY